MAAVAGRLAQRVVEAVPARHIDRIDRRKEVGAQQVRGLALVGGADREPLAVVRPGLLDEPGVAHEGVVGGGEVGEIGGRRPLGDVRQQRGGVSEPFLVGDLLVRRLLAPTQERGRGDGVRLDRGRPDLLEIDELLGFRAGAVERPGASDDCRGCDDCTQRADRRDHGGGEAEAARSRARRQRGAQPVWRGGDRSEGATRCRHVRALHGSFLSREDAAYERGSHTVRSPS